MDKTYHPGAIEERWYARWEAAGAFQPQGEGAPYCIAIPPPNVTGILHMGHALDHTLEDIPIRFQRMRGRRALWIPGTDHAGIATQNVVERAVQQEGTTRRAMGREAFVERVWAWVHEFGGQITRQMRRLGDSVDWSRERFTLDEGLSRAVTEVFLRLYRQGLIYRGHYIINWCPGCGTALSDEEVTHLEQAGYLWHIRYPSVGKGEGIVVATTRPETMLGDTAVAVHPEDPRYRRLIGSQVMLPLLERPLPVIADPVVERELGTGAVKVTPAHDPTDYEIGRRHNLPSPVVLDRSGCITAAGGPYQGLGRAQAREAVVKDLEQGGYLVRIEEHTHAVGHCYRCRSAIEPYLSEQWFVRMQPLARRALEQLDQGRPRIQPERWEKVYRHWLENIRDWCISRQLWWGHRIPVWYCGGEQAHPLASAQPPEGPCERCGHTEWVQDPDVLDTWFSSWLWPFSTLGWPEQTEDYNTFYPTSLLVSGYDILFFWDARMVMAGLAFTDQVPFETLYVHGMIQDERGRPMSKSLGNGIDPIEMIERYGADAVRYSLCQLTTEGQDMKLSESKFEMGRNFANKIWNASRFVMLHLASGPVAEGTLELELADRWILSRYQGRVRRLTHLLEGLKYSEAARELYSFIWNEFCDWYLELVKERLRTPGSEQAATARALLAALLDGLLRLLHPYMPFVTSEIWERLGETLGGQGVALALQSNTRSEDDLVILGATSERIVLDPLLMTSSWPRAGLDRPDAEAEQQMTLIQEVVGAIRNIKGEMRVPPGVVGMAHLRVDQEQQQLILQEQAAYVCLLASLQQVRVAADLPRPAASGSAVVAGLEIFLPLEGLIDLDMERERLEREASRVQGQLTASQGRLSSPTFIERAPVEVVERERARCDDQRERLEKIRTLLAQLGQ